MQVYIEGGFAYVPVQRVVSIVVARYRMGISRSLMEASNHFAFVTSDARFGPLLQVHGIVHYTVDSSTVYGLQYKTIFYTIDSSAVYGLQYKTICWTVQYNEV